MFSFHWISVLLIIVTFYAYLANIIFSCDLALSAGSHYFNVVLTHSFGTNIEMHHCPYCK